MNEKGNTLNGLRDEDNNLSRVYTELINQYNELSDKIVDSER